MDAVLAGGFQEELLAVANRKAARLQRDRASLYERLEQLKRGNGETNSGVDLAEAWRGASYGRKKAAVMVLIRKIVIGEHGGVKVYWNL